jgi:purine-binding chemotaxis protein CheW
MTSVKMQQSETDMVDTADLTDFVTMAIDDQWFGLSVKYVRDILGPRQITDIPLSPPEVAGSLNLRGRIITALNLRQALGLPTIQDPSESMSIVVEHNDELYSLLIDEVGEVLNLNEDNLEPNPGTLDDRWKNLSEGIFQLEDRLLLSVDIDQLLTSLTGGGEDNS